MADNASTEQRPSRGLRTSSKTRAVPHLDVTILTAKSQETEETLWPQGIDYDEVEIPKVSHSSESSDERLDILDLLDEG